MSGNQGASPELQTSFRDNAQFAYQALINQGYSDDAIYYLSSSGLPGVKASATAQNLRYALTEWGATDTEDLAIYLIADKVQLDGQPGLVLSKSDQNGAFEQISLAQLRDWLNTRQAQPSFNQSTGLLHSGLITVILDSCYSGDALNILNPNGQRRLLISSANAGEAAHFTNHQLANGQTFATELSFSRVFWQNINHGANLRDAFSSAGTAVNLVAGVQTPQLDDNFNGLGNDAGDITQIPVLTKDGDLARKITLGAGVLAAEDTPRILSHTPNSLISSDETELNLELASTSTIQDAWVIISRPDYSPDCSAYDQLPTLHLTRREDEPNHWQARYDKFNINGDYQFTFYAVDQNNQQSIPSSAILTRVNAANLVEGGPQTGLLEPNNTLAEASYVIANDDAQALALETSDDQDWIGFYAINGNTYTIVANQVGVDIDLGIQIYDSLGQQRWPSKPNSIIDAGQKGESEQLDWRAPEDGFFYLKMSNRGQHTGVANGYQLLIYQASGGKPSTIKGTISNSCTKQSVSLAQVSVTTEGFKGYTTKSAPTTGLYGISLYPPIGGQRFDFVVNASGFQPQRFSKTLYPDNKISTQDIQLRLKQACGVVKDKRAFMDAQNLSGVFEWNLSNNVNQPLLTQDIRFSHNEDIPTGLNLNNALSHLTPMFLKQPKALDLNQDILEPMVYGTLLQQVQALPIFSTQTITQDEQGILQFTFGNKHYAVQPVTLSQLPLPVQPGLYISAKGTLEIITAPGRKIDCISMIQVPEFFETMLIKSNRELATVDSQTGNLSIMPTIAAVTSSRQVLRPDLYSTVSQTALHPELSLDAHSNYPGVLVYPANDNLVNTSYLNQQMLYPSVYDWTVLSDYIYQQSHSRPRLSPKGILYFQYQGERLQGRFDAKVTLGKSRGAFQFERSFDQNHDGYPDFEVIYPDGYQQWLFQLPKIESSSK